MKALKFIKNHIIYFILLLCCIVFSIASPNFLTSSNLLNILRASSMMGIVECGVTMVMIGGGMDMSVGGQMSLNGFILALLMVNFQVPLFVVILVALGLGLMEGIANGVIGIKLGVAPMVVTLATMTIFQALTKVITAGKAVSGFSDAFLSIGKGYVFGIIPIPVLVFVIIVAICQFVMTKTYFGRQIFAMGGNTEAARLSGVNTNLLTVMLYAICGFITAIASIIMLSRTASAQTTAGGSYAFDCMTAAVLGGIGLKGGEGSVIGVVIGAIVIGVLSNGFVMIGVNENWQSVIKGIILLIAVGIDKIKIVEKEAA